MTAPVFHLPSHSSLVHLQQVCIPPIKSNKEKGMAFFSHCHRQPPEPPPRAATCTYNKTLPLIPHLYSGPYTITTSILLPKIKDGGTWPEDLVEKKKKTSDLFLPTTTCGFQKVVQPPHFAQLGARKRQDLTITPPEANVPTQMRSVGVVELNTTPRKLLQPEMNFNQVCVVSREAFSCSSFVLTGSPNYEKSLPQGESLELMGAKTLVEADFEPYRDFTMECPAVCDPFWVTHLESNDQQGLAFVLHPVCTLFIVAESNKFFSHPETSSAGWVGKDLFDQIGGLLTIPWKPPDSRVAFKLLVFYIGLESRPLVISRNQLHSSTILFPHVAQFQAPRDLTFCSPTDDIFLDRSTVAFDVWGCLPFIGSGKVSTAERSLVSR